MAGTTSKRNVGTKSNNIILKDKRITLSDENLGAKLRKVYEQARQDANCFKLYKHYGVFLSASGTLFITLLTSEFNTFDGIDGKVITTIAWILCAILFTVGIALAIICASKKATDEISERDHAVTTIMDSIVNNP